MHFCACYYVIFLNLKRLLCVPTDLLPSNVKYQILQHYCFNGFVQCAESLPSATNIIYIFIYIHIYLFIYKITKQMVCAWL